VAETALNTEFRTFVSENLLGNAADGLATEGLQAAAEELIGQGFLQQALVEALGEEAAGALYETVLQGVLDGFADVGLVLFLA
jgi:hypothetical protein